jgi:hypothetical protein
MCRNIRPLFNFEPPATEQEIQAAALQYVRKVSGATKPSAANVAPFERAIAEIAKATRKLVESLETTAPPKNRETEAAKARAKAALRYAVVPAAPAAAVAHASAARTAARRQPRAR